MNDDRRTQRSRRRRLFGVGVRTVGRGVLHALPGQDRARYWARSGADWFETLGELKGAAMKLGQVASQYRDLLPPQLIEQLERLQRDAQPRPFDEMHAVLDAAWGADEWNAVATIEHEAAAAASIGQVHRARLADGRAVVVKIRYPEVAASIDADVANLGRVLKWSRLLPVDSERLDAVLGEVRDRLKEETDYTTELANLQAMRGLALPGFVLPAPVVELCTESVLVMKEVASTTFQSLRDTDQATRDAVGEQIVANLARQLFEHRLLHADPHPGNYGITEDGEVALYDFGCLKRIGDTEAEGLRAILAAGLDGDWPAVHAALADLGIVSRERYHTDKAVYDDIYRRHRDAALEPIAAQRLYDFAEGSAIQRIRAEILADLKHWQRFNPAPELVFVTRTISGIYWLLRGIGARVPVYEMLEASAAPASRGQ